MTQSHANSTILVTGGGGFIGGALLRYFAARGWRAIGCGRRRPARVPDAVEWRAYDLASTEISDELFYGVDVLVHAAYAKEDLARNVTGSTRLLEQAQRNAIKCIVFISSLAAHEAALSQYGKQKYALEKLFEGRGALVVRPGLVLGEGGIFGAMRAYLREHRLVPLIDGGRQPLQTVYVDDLAAALFAAIARGLRGTYTIAECDPVPYREFYRALGERMGVSVIFVPIPFWAADAAVRAARLLRVPLPIDRENLLGLKAMRADDRPRLQPPERDVGDYRSNIERVAPVGNGNRSG
jgi:nucleoside-diphosphate-sugar epimerase